MKKLKKEFQVENLKLNVDSPEDFLFLQWQTSPNVDFHFLLYRILFFLSFTMTVHIIFKCSPVDHLSTFYIYYTYWTFINNVVYATLSLINVTIGYVLEVTGQSPGGGFDMRPLFACTQIFANISYCCALCVTFSFWSGSNLLNELNWASKMFHTWNSILLLMDFVVASVPFRLLHVYCPVIFSLMYAFFSYCFYYFDMRNGKGLNVIYKLIDWRHEPLRTYGFVMMGVLMVFVMQFVLFWIHTVKMYWYRKYFWRASDAQEWN